MRENLVLKHIAQSQAAETREGQLEEAIKALLLALETQHLDGKAPGEYFYSGNVMDAQANARSRIKMPKARRPRVPKADQATSRRVG